MKEQTVEQVKDRKIGWNDFVHIRKWQMCCIGFILVFMSGAIEAGFLLNWKCCITNGIIAIIFLIVTMTKMSEDKKLNKINGVKRFWLLLLSS